MAAAVRMPSANQPKSMTRPTRWSDVVEEAYRFQIAGYRDEIEYREVQKTDHVSSVINYKFYFILLNKSLIGIPVHLLKQK